jgi:hypothetical protein
VISVAACHGRLSFVREYGGGLTETVMLGEADSARMALLIATRAEPPPPEWFEVICACFDLAPDLAESRTLTRSQLH